MRKSKTELVERREGRRLIACALVALAFHPVAFLTSRLTPEFVWLHFSVSLLVSGMTAIFFFVAFGSACEWVKKKKHRKLLTRVIAVLHPSIMSVIAAISSAYVSQLPEIAETFGDIHPILTVIAAIVPCTFVTCLTLEQPNYPDYISKLDRIASMAPFLLRCAQIEIPCAQDVLDLLSPALTLSTALAHHEHRKARIELNEATIEDLELVSCIDSQRAKTIREYAERKGFKSVDDLDDILDLSCDSRDMSVIKSQVRVNRRKGRRRERKPKRRSLQNSPKAKTPPAGREGGVRVCEASRQKRLREQWRKWHKQWRNICHYTNRAKRIAQHHILISGILSRSHKARPGEMPKTLRKVLQKGTSLSPKKIVCFLVISAVAAIVLEIGTLFGAPAATPLHVADWSRRRLIFFFVISLLLCIVIEQGGYRKRAAAFLRTIPKNRWAKPRRFILEVVVLAILAGACICLVRLVTNSPDPRPSLVCATAVVCVVLFIVHWKHISQAAEWGFLILCIGMGFVICISLPATTRVSWDDSYHYNSALSLSYVTNAEYTDADKDMVTSKNVLPLLRSTAPSKENTFVVSIEYDSVKKINALERKLSQSKVHKLHGTETISGGSYVRTSAIGHVPYAIGLWTGRLLHLSFVKTFMLGKLFGVLFYAAFFFLGIRFLRSGKLLVSALALLPTSVFMAANYSYDPWLISLVALAFCRFVGELQRTKLSVSLRSTLSILAPFVLGVMAKAVYLPLALVFLFMPRQKFARHRHRLYYCLGVAAVCLAVPAIVVLAPIIQSIAFSSTGNRGDIRGGDDVNATEQVHFILENPSAALAALISFTAKIFAPINFLDGGILNFPYIFGGNVGHIKATGPLAYPPAINPHFPDGGMIAKRFLSGVWLLLIIVLAVVDQRQDLHHTRHESALGIVSLLCIIFSYVLVCESLYIMFTAVGLNTIVGVQYRYFYPLFTPFFLVCINLYFGFVKFVRKLSVVTFIALGVLIVLTLSLIFVSLY